MSPHDFAYNQTTSPTSTVRPWPYVLMATMAGLAYGWAWRKGGKITAAALTHTWLNFTWAILFGS